MTIYKTIEEALGDIANRSFYENAAVEKLDDGTYSVTDHHTGVEEYAAWSYEDGITLPTHVLDYSPMHEPYEHYADAGHVSYNLPAAIDAIESGKRVGFTYVVAEAKCQCGEDGSYEDYMCMGDHVVGWALIATDESD